MYCPSMINSIGDGVTRNQLLERAGRAHGVAERPGIPGLDGPSGMGIPDYLMVLLGGRTRAATISFDEAWHFPI